MSPEEELRQVVSKLHEPVEPDFDLCIEVGSGPLEEIIRSDGETLWPEIERLARHDVRFRKALTAVWAYDSAEFDRREALLMELGEAVPVEINFIAQSNDFQGVKFGWRGLEVQSTLAPHVMSNLLRQIAARIERSE